MIETRVQTTPQRNMIDRLEQALKRKGDSHQIWGSWADRVLLDALPGSATSAQRELDSQ